MVYLSIPVYVNNSHVVYALPSDDQILLYESIVAPALSLYLPPIVSKTTKRKIEVCASPSLITI